MNHSTINNQFIFNLPVGFVPAGIEAKRLSFLKKNRILYDSVLDFLNSCIKEITFPDVTFEQTEQTLMRGKKRQFKSAKNVYDSFSRDIRVTFRNVSSNLSYLLMLECILYHYNDVINTFMEQMIVQIIDEHRDEIYRIVFKEIIIKNLSDFVMQYNNQLNEDNTFTLTFTYNFMDIEYVMDNSDIIKDERSALVI